MIRYIGTALIAVNVPVQRGSSTEKRLNVARILLVLYFVFVPYLRHTVGHPVLVLSGA